MRVTSIFLRRLLRGSWLLIVAGAALAQQGATPPALRITGITPSGSNVPQGREIVLQFDRPVVPLGRMDRTAAEIPVAISPALDCEWRWLDPSALACELGADDALQPATEYTLTVEPGIRALDGSVMDGVRRHVFTTERPRVAFAGFATWRSPGTPVIRAVFTQPVSESSVREHLFVTAAGQGGGRIALEVAADTEQRELPRFVRAPGERVFVDFGERQTQSVDDQPTEVAGETARRVWLLEPRTELTLDSRFRLLVEPGLEPAVGTARGDERRTVVEFATFPELRFLGVVCRTQSNEELVIPASGARPAAGCNPLGSIGLQFSAPVLGSEIKEHVTFVPDLAGGRTDYDPWANRGDYSMLGQPHERGRAYTVWLPERLQAAREYRVAVRSPADGPKDEFGRALPGALDFAFMTDHRPPDYTLATPTAVLEHGVDSDVPLYVTNLTSFSLDYRTLTPAGASTALERSTALPAVEDVQFGVPLDVRSLLGGASGAVYGKLSTVPALDKSSWQDGLFAQVTPYQVHVKLGHFNTLVWVTELATGTPVRGARVQIYVDRIAELGAAVPPLATAATDASGIAVLGGSQTLDPDLTLLGYGCSTDNDRCPRLFVRVDGTAGMALMPLEYRFEVDTYRASSYTIFPDQRRDLGHLRAWGTTAQGVYRAGDTLDYKIYVRDQSNETLVAAPSGPYELTIVDPTGQTVHQVDDVQLSAFGAVSGSYTIPPNAAVGWYQFRLSTKFLGGADGVEPGSFNDPEVVRYPLRVLVSDFTPSPFGVRTTLNGDLFGAGDEVVATTLATLFSGGPYGDAEARLTAQIVPKPFVSPHAAAAGFMFDTGDRPAPIMIAQDLGRVDAQGEHAHTFRLPDSLGTQIVHGALTVEGAVRDDRGKYVASAASANFVAVDRLVGLKSSRWVFEEDKPASVAYLVVDAAGTPAAGTDVQIAIQRLETKASRVRGAGTAYLTEFIEDWVDAGSCAGRSQDTAQSCEFVPTEPGSYRLTATVTDTRGRPHATTLHTWVVGKGAVVWSGENDDALEIVPEQGKYAVGDTARYLLKNPYPGARALVTIERYGVLKQWVQALDSSTPVLEFRVEKDFLPGFYLSVLVMSPRVAAPPPEVGELDLGKPAFKIGYVAVPVEDPYKKIDVTARTDREVYKPGETVRVRLKAAARERERREPIEVAVAVLDESVLDLIQGGTSYFDPYDGFYELEGLDVRNFGLLTRLVGRQKIELKGANPGGDGGAAFSMRSVFKYVSYWNPSIELDARGNGSFEFTLPDNLTGWRVLVLAATPTDRLGLGETTFRVNLPTEVRPAMPNQVTEGDRFDAAFTVLNRTDTARDIRVSIAASGDVAAPASRDETVSLEPFARTTVTLPVEAAPVRADRNVSAGKIGFTVSARDARDGDGLRHELTVLKRRGLETAASYGSLDGAAATEALAFPAYIRTDAGDVGVVLAPSVIGNVDGAFRYLRDFAYASWEQLLTKGVMAAHFTRLREYLSPDLEWPEAESLPAAVLAQAASFQAPNGGMAYYVPQDQYASPYLSAYTALALEWLREDGHAVPESVQTKLHAYLDAFLKRDTAPDFYTRGMASTVRAVALAALAKSGKLNLADLVRYREHVDYMSLFGKAHYLQAARAVPGGETIASEVQQQILQSSVRSAGKLTFNEVLDDGYLRISATPLLGNCAVLSALSANDAGNTLGDVPLELVRAISAARGNRDHWENTQENMFCMASLLDYSRRYESTAPSLTVRAAIGGQPLGTARFTSLRDAPVTLARPIGPADLGAAATLSIEPEGAGRVYYSARMSYAPAGEAAGGVNAGIDLKKEVSVQRGGEWVLLGSPAELRRGELVRVDLYVSLPTARNFVVVDDPVPGGLEPVNRDLANASLVDAAEGDFRAAGGAWWFSRNDWIGYGASRYSFYHQERRHDAVRFYSDYLPAGNYHLSYAAQAIAVGEFASLPARAVEMYDPDVYGTSASGTLRVGPAE